MLWNRLPSGAHRQPRRSSAAASRLVALAWLALPALASGCGNGTEFGGDNRQIPDANLAGNPSSGTDPSQGGHDSDDAVNGGPGSDTNTIVNGGRALKDLTWFFQCDAAPAPVPVAAGPDSPVVVGAGPHRFAKGTLDGAPVTFAGALCPPAQVARDIVFVIDTSGSMGDSDANDPVVGSSCARLDALNAVIDSVPQGPARFGIVTFDSTVGRVSSQLFDTKAALLTNIAGRDSVVKAVCAAEGGTEYAEGLNAASTLLARGRAGATKEIYFVSDGQPEDGEYGPNAAATLKTTGVNVGTAFIPVTIATVMLGAESPAVMRDHIASRGPSGAPLHADARQAAQLGKLLTDLAANDLVSASVKYRASGTTSWTTRDALAVRDRFNFRLPSFTMSQEMLSAGLEVSYEMVDQHGARTQTAGTLVWATP